MSRKMANWGGSVMAAMAAVATMVLLPAAALADAGTFCCLVFRDLPPGFLLAFMIALEGLAWQLGGEEQPTQDDEQDDCGCEQEHGNQPQHAPVGNLRVLGGAPLIDELDLVIP